MNKQINFIIKVVLLSGLVLVPLIFYNFYIDTYGIFRTNFSKQINNPNMRQCKTKFLLQNPLKYDSFIFGSSRVGFINPALLTNGNYYNYSVSAGVPKDALDNLQQLLDNKIIVKHVILGLDMFSYKRDPMKNYYKLYRYPYQKNHIKQLAFYIRYLITPQSLGNFLKVIKRDYTPTKFFDITNTGMTIASQKDLWIEQNIKAHSKQEIFNKPTIEFNGNRLNKTIAEIGDFINLCKQNSINYTIFINPIHQTTYLAYDPIEFLKFKKSLVNITDYYDFSGINDITTNNYYYYETSHYRPIVGELITKTIYNNKKNFGSLVTKQNINKHIKLQKKELEALAK